MTAARIRSFVLAVARRDIEQQEAGVETTTRRVA
jgi:hypothetical protein